MTSSPGLHRTGLTLAGTYGDRCVMISLARVGGAPFLAIPALVMLLGADAGADARDLPRGAAAAPAHTGCESFGPDFHKVEGSETCIRVSGSVRLETTIQSGGGSILSGPARR